MEVRTPPCRVFVRIRDYIDGTQGNTQPAGRMLYGRWVVVMVVVNDEWVLVYPLLLV